MRGRCSVTSASRKLRNYRSYVPHLPKHRKRLAALSVLFLINTYCATFETIERDESTHKISANGGYADVGYRSYGCDGDMQDSQRHRQVGGSVEYRYDHRQGLSVGAVVSLAKGDLTSYHDLTPTRKSYWIAGIQPFVGRDWKHAGFELGFGVAFDDKGETKVVGGLITKVGNLNYLWFESGISVMPPFDGRQVFAGMGGRTSWIRFNAGIALQGFLLPELSRDENVFTLSQWGKSGDLGGYANLEFILPGGIGLGAGSVFGVDNYSLRLGVSLTL